MLKKLSKITNFSILNVDQVLLQFYLNQFFIEIKSETENQIVTNDLIGLTMDEGKPQLPVYSTLFQIDPKKI